ncbi:hypothetical protein Golax_015077 [Gossypium laxum]|uniref:Uncharacterized protein n=1 Tax=Gossypium laxum TaxID=34288 RepID=A0A7J8ZX85_9ROSI|nr:hypothetical protein [Gossypium laxum]
MVPNEILYRCVDFDWVPLLGIGELSDMLPCSYCDRIDQDNSYQ